ncbi:hypothetical protein BOW51_09970 [Solemya velesiana gill symbiont]|uniref:histidine kinase n=1 Tax=Solemya velesiana gill symbiont TaxID=1918948 RepID=A0A1T2KSP6_9GAMM|nr:hypothetical protein BOW51_09970 [Solemya velesiana gill symbiont]
MLGVHKGQTDKAHQVASNILSDTLKVIQQRRPDEYGEMFVTNRLGATVAMTKTLSDYYQADEYWWKAGSKLGESGAFFDDRGYDETVKTIVVGVTVPIRDSSEVIGVFKINYKLQSILNIITQKSAEAAQIIGLVRSIGDAIVSSRPEVTEALVGHEEEMASMPEGGWWEDAHEGAAFIGAHAPVRHNFNARILKDAKIGVSGETAKEITWHVISELDEKVAFGSLDDLRNTAMTLGTGALLLAALLGYMLSRSISAPLSIMRRGAETIGSGNLDSRINLRQKNEFGDLARSFDGMAEQLKETLASRDELNREITERKQAEAESNHLRNYLNDVFDTMPSVLVGTEKNGKVLHWNRQAAEVTCITADQAIGRLVQDLMPMVPDVMKNIECASGSGQAVRLDKQPYRKGTETHFSEITIYPLTAAGIEGIMIRMEDMMMQTEKMLSVGGLAAGMAHEINNPLGGMLQGMQNIRRRLSPELEKNRESASEPGIDLNKLQKYLEQREIFKFMESMAESGDRAGDIINNMLRFSRKAEEGFETVNMAELIDKTIELAAVDYDMKKKYDFRGIAIERDYEEGLPPIQCNTGEIQQVILNLLRNAAQAIYEHPEKREPAKISIRLRQKDKMIHLQVEDNGPGMDDATCSRVFEPFFTTKPPGLGLSVSYNRRAHGRHAGGMCTGPGQHVYHPATAESKSRLSDHEKSPRNRSRRLTGCSIFSLSGTASVSASSASWSFTISPPSRKRCNRSSSMSVST